MEKARKKLVALQVNITCHVAKGLIGLGIFQCLIWSLFRMIREGEKFRSQVVNSQVTITLLENSFSANVMLSGGKLRNSNDNTKIQPQRKIYHASYVLICSFLEPLFIGTSFYMNTYFDSKNQSQDTRHFGSFLDAASCQDLQGSRPRLHDQRQMTDHG